VIDVGEPRPRALALAGLVQGYRDFLSASQGHSSHPESFRELDDERVLVLAHARGQTKRTGMDLGQMQTNVAVVYHVRGGKVVRLVLYLDRDRALVDLSLEG
jgi:ketosteroid isomerase-like protein